MPSIIISADKTTICSGTTVKFTATPTDIGPAAVYQWVVNGINPGAGSNGITFTTSNLHDQDKVTCNVSNTGGTPSALSSNAIIISYYTNETPSVVVGQTLTNKCIATFEASPINGGSAPVYKWTINGVDMNVNSRTFVDYNPVDKDLIACTLINTTTCSPTNVATQSIKLSADLSSIKLAIAASAPGGNVCAGETVSLSITAQPEVPGTQYRLFINGISTGSSVTHTGPAFGSAVYKDDDVIDVRILNPDPCLATGPVISNQVKIKMDSPPTVSITADKNNVCAGAPVTFTAFTFLKPFTYAWKINGLEVVNEQSDKFTTAVLKDADQVTCTIVSNGACKTPVTAAPVLMHIYPIPVITLPKNMEVAPGKSVQFQPSFNTSIVSYKWSPTSGLSNSTIADPVASPLEPTTYQLTVVSDGGCTSTAVVKVNVAVVITPPNTFTPNGDGINDTWDIPSLAPYTQSAVAIFDRYGQVVFRSVGYGKPWDGALNGKRLPAGTYYYLIDTKRSPAKFSGSVTLLR